jgi:hypothetical protein
VSGAAPRNVRSERGTAGLHRLAVQSLDQTVSERLRDRAITYSPVSTYANVITSYGSPVLPVREAPPSTGDSAPVGDVWGITGCLIVFVNGFGVP